MRSKVELGPGDIRLETLALLGVALAAASGMMLAHGERFVVAAVLAGLGIVFSDVR